MRNVNLFTSIYFAKATAWIGFFCILGCGSMSLSPSNEEICREFPTVAEEVDGIQAALSVLVKPGRKIASVAPPPEEGLNRDAWLKWGEGALKRTQWAKDSLEHDKRGRKAVPSLNEAGMSLVSFHGFVEQRKWKKASLELDKVESGLKRARKIACAIEPGKAPARAPASVVEPARKSKKTGEPASPSVKKKRKSRH